jgi:thioredoxin reductase (NADPH)
MRHPRGARSGGTAELRPLPPGLRPGNWTRRAIAHLFLLIGAAPNTKWLAGSGVAADPKGFVLTSADAGKDARPLETSRPGVYAIGDVRLNSIKRVGAAIGEGAQVVAALHGCLAAHRVPAASFRMDPSDATG